MAVLLLVMQLVLVGSLPGGTVWAEDLAVPAQVQAELIAKLAAYDRNFPERAAGKATITIIARSSEVDSARAAAQMSQALKDLPSVGGLPHEVSIVPFTSARDLGALCTRTKVGVVYLTPGLGREIEAIAKELEGKNVLTVAGTLGYVSRGAVLGFELVLGRTKLVINLGQAKKQNVQFRAEVLKLMRIVG